MEEESPFDLANCEIKLEFTFDALGKECFPRHKSQTEKFAEFGMLTMPNRRFQTEEVNMEFETVDFNWFANPHTEKVLNYINQLQIINTNQIYIYIYIFFFSRIFNLQKP